MPPKKVKTTNTTKSTSTLHNGIWGLFDNNYPSHSDSGTHGHCSGNTGGHSGGSGDSGGGCGE